MIIYPMEFLAAYWPRLIGWSSALVLVARGYKVVHKILSYGGDFRDARADQKLMMTNHLPHLQMGLDDVNTTITKVNENLEMMREDMKEHMQGLRDDLRALLLKRE